MLFPPHAVLTVELDEDELLEDLFSVLVFCSCFEGLAAGTPLLEETTGVSLFGPFFCLLIGEDFVEFLPSSSVSSLEFVSVN